MLEEVYQINVNQVKNHSEKIVYARKLEHNAAGESFASIKPPWLTMMENIITKTERQGYKADTGWRLNVTSFLDYLQQYFRREPFGGDGAVGAAAVLSQGYNTNTNKEREANGEEGVSRRAFLLLLALQVPVALARGSAGKQCTREERKEYINAKLRAKGYDERSLSK